MCALDVSDAFISGIFDYCILIRVSANPSKLCSDWSTNQMEAFCIESTDYAIASVVFHKNCDWINWTTLTTCKYSLATRD